MLGQEVYKLFYHSMLFSSVWNLMPIEGRRGVFLSAFRLSANLPTCVFASKEKTSEIFSPVIHAHYTTVFDENVVRDLRQE